MDKDDALDAQDPQHVGPSEEAQPVSSTRRSRPALRHLTGGYRGRLVSSVNTTSPPSDRTTTEVPEETRSELTSSGSSQMQGNPLENGQATEFGGTPPTTTTLCSSPAVVLQLTDLQFARFGITRFVSYICNLNQGGPIPSSDFHSHCLPPMSVKSYVERIVRYCNCTAEALLFGFMLLLKYTFHSGHRITVYNAHRLLITGIVLGIKIRDDTYFNNAYYGKIGGIRAREMCKLELLFLEKMNWEMHISEVEYAEMCKLLGELIRTPTREEVTAFQVAHPHEIDAYNLEEDQIDTPTHGPESVEGSPEGFETQEDSQSAVRARALGAYRRHHWKTRVEPWLSELAESTLRKNQQQVIIEQRDRDAEEERWRRYREEDNAKLLKRRSEKSCWLSPIALDAKDDRGFSTAPVLSEPQSTTTDLSHNGNHPTTATNSSTGMSGILERVQELAESTSTANSLLHSSRQSTTPGSGINVNAQPYYYVSSRHKIQQKAQAASSVATEAPSSTSGTNSSSGSGNGPHMRCSSWRNPSLNEETFPFQRKQSISFNLTACQSRYGDRNDEGQPTNYPEGSGSSHMSCFNFVACQKREPYHHSEDGSFTFSSSKYTHRSANDGIESQPYQELVANSGVCFSTAPLRGFPNHGSKKSSNVSYSIGAPPKHSQGSVGKKRPKPDAYVDRLYKD
ncbi:unnamed protein product [Phytomonas sp. Hart1]|nr:unnamed protein product [Phytomonas sp. Hart1]|eukprot:CCW69080.1 unnamed protein product [Phytomonas sp. isolate Hart1]